MLRMDLLSESMMLYRFQDSTYRLNDIREDGIILCLAYHHSSCHSIQYNRRNKDVHLLLKYKEVPELHCAITGILRPVYRTILQMTEPIVIFEINLFYLL